MAKFRCVLTVAWSVSAALISWAAEAKGPACQTVACQTDDDCGDGTRCLSGADTSCTPEGGTRCGVCVVKWQAACTGDGECGDGFACVPSGRKCDCSGEAGAVPDGATVTSCADAAEPPPVCEAGGACVAASPCDGGSCLCWPVKVCVALNTPCSDSETCGGGGSCVAGLCAPADWNCSNGSCEPPCFGRAAEGGTLSLGPGDATTASPEYAATPFPECACHAAGSEGGRGRTLWSVSLLVGAGVIRRVRRAPSRARATCR